MLGMLPVNLGHKESCGVALKLEPLKREELKGTFIMLVRTLLFVYGVYVQAEDCSCVCLSGYVCADF